MSYNIFYFVGFSYKYVYQPCDGSAGGEVAGGEGEVGGVGGVLSKIYLFSFGGTNFCCLNILRVKIINVKNLMSFKWFPPRLFTAVRKR